MPLLWAWAGMAPAAEVKLHRPELTASVYASEAGQRWNPDLRRQLLAAVENADSEALPPKRYHLEALRRAGDGADDRLFTDAFLTLAGDLANGLVNPRQTQRQWNAPQLEDADLLQLLETALSAHNVKAVLDGLNANNPRYRGLRLYYNQLRQQQRDTAGIQLEQIAINMERQRWLPQDLAESYVLVNIPDYSVKVFADRVNIFSTGAVIGKRSTPTPAFVNELKHIVMSPAWYPPPSLSRRGRVFVAPGVRGNPMGKVKFLFPNPHAIYLHDTPNKHLFGGAHSAGCVRVDQAERLAQVLLRNEADWNDPKKVHSAMHKRRESWAHIAPKPIYLVYWTVWAEPMEESARNTLYSVKVAKDVYGKDQALLRQYRQALRPYQ